MHRLRLSPIEARDALLKCKGLSDEQLELMGPLLGSQEEQDQVREWATQGGPEHHPARLGEVERFVLETMAVPFAMQRVDLMRLARRLSADIEHSKLPEVPKVAVDPVLAPIQE